MITRRLLRPAGKALPGFSSSWTCPSCTRASILPQQQQRRRLHDVPTLGHAESFTEGGIPGFLSAKGFDIAWTQYQTMLTHKLSELVAGEPIENMKIKDLITQFARDPMNASLFNHASALHNNHFYFSTLAPAPLHLDNVPQLKESLIRTFGSIETLRTTFLDTAAGMFGPGFVWLVWARNAGSSSSPSTYRNANANGNWRILTTYLAGTPYAQAGYRQQSTDMATQNYAGAFGAHSQNGREQANIPPGSTQVMPVMCVNTWEHVYMYDYGVQAKRKYLEDWWRCIDWGIVDTNAPPGAKEQSFKFSSP